MADTTTNEAKISIKVIVDKVNKRVVYAEADHTFVDILFSFITLPLGTIVRLLEKHNDKEFEALGSLNNLYQSLKDLPDCYVYSEEVRCLLLNPRSVSHNECRGLKIYFYDTEPMEYFCCRRLCSTMPMSTWSGAKCRNCYELMNITPEDYYSFMSRYFCSDDVNKDTGGVFVVDAATFIVTDDLHVMPYTSASSIRLLTDLGITDPSNLEEIKLDIDCKQMLLIFKTALSINSVFTYLVFDRFNTIRDTPVFCQDSTFDEDGLMKIEVSLSSKMLVEVYLQKSTGKLLFAEANTDFVEFLFDFLSIPLATVIGDTLTEPSSLSCMDNIYKSILSMSEGTCLRSQNLLLKPHYKQPCSSKENVFSLKRPENITSYIDPRIDKRLLKQSRMFMVTDDLIITPSSSSSTMDILKKLNVRLNDIERNEISIGLQEGLDILKASLTSMSTLTNGLMHQQER